MNTYYEDPQSVIYNGDAIQVLKELPDCSVHTCVTSPPYWGLRDYGTAAWEGGDSAHTHAQGRTLCQCGAERLDSQIGIEPTPEEYVAGLVEVFREVRRVLRDDGTLWLNIGDSYSSGARKHTTVDNLRKRGMKPKDNIEGTNVRPPMVRTMKPKDLVGIPWMLAFALRADGWFLRCDIIWAKPNPMPESVLDRPTKSHEYLFLLSKSATYYYDVDAIREKYSREWWKEDIGDTSNPDRRDGGNVGARAEGKGANKRSVWTVATSPYAEAHFATFPPNLIKPCILAGAPHGGTVLDPFVGAGTTILVCKSLGRRCIGIDLSKKYLNMTIKRCQQLGMDLFGN